MVSGIKDKIIIAGVILFALFSVYKYHQSLINKINDQNNTIINLNVELSNLTINNQSLETSVKQLEEQLNIERDICTARTGGIIEYNDNIEASKDKVNDSKKKTDEKIDTINKDTTLSEVKKKEKILNAEYDLLAGLVE